MALKILVVFVISIYLVESQSKYPPSQCPRIFQYEPQKEKDRWFGVITLISDSDLSGVWLRLAFDKPSLQLGNWFGDIKTSDNMNFLITNRNHQMKANMPYSLRIYIKYDPSQTMPKLMSVRLNAKTVCPEEESTTPIAITGGQYFGNSNQQIPTEPPNGYTLGVTKEPSIDDIINNNHILNIEIECGTVVHQPKPLITYGQATKEGEFPWHAAIYYGIGADLQYICGASLISRSHLITVAHCVVRRRTQGTLNPDGLIVYLGKYYLKRWSNPGIQNSQVSMIFPHPEYNPRTYANDIALLKMVNPVMFTDYVRPICLWAEDISLNEIMNKPGIVVGWGFDESGKVTEELAQANMPVVSNDTCIRSFPDFFSRFTTQQTFCAGFRNGTSVCNGDSGGGMVFPKTTSSTNSQVWQLRGLVSISMALQNKFECDSSFYVVFTDIAKYLDWIGTTMQKM